MSDHLQPIANQRVTDQVFSSLVRYLLSGDLKPGDRLPTEAEIAESLGAGRNSVREAMKVLQILGMVDRRQGHGSFFADPNDNSFEPLLIPVAASISQENDLVQLRTVFEVGTVDLIIDAVRDEQLGIIEERMLQLESLVSDDQFRVEDAAEADVAFHVAMAESTGNKALISLSNLIMQLFKRSMAEALSDDHDRASSLEDHRALVNAIKSRDKDAAKSVIRRSFQRWRHSVHLDS